MNIVTVLLTVYFVLNLIRRKVPVSRVSRFFLYLGIVLPAVDYLLRFTEGEIWFQTDGLIFHSIVYQSLFWGIVALLRWVYCRDIRKAGKLLLPLVGLGIYAFFTLFSMENVSFLAPFSNASFSLGWITPGYLVPTVAMVVLWFTILGSELSSKLVSIIAILVLVFFIAYSGISYHRINRELLDIFPKSNVISIVPANHQQTMWRVVALQQNRYTHTRFHFIQGQRGNIEEQTVPVESESSQMALLDPVVRELYWKSFRSPVIQVDIQNESMLISIRELVPLIEPLWVKQVQVRKNSSGQMVQFDIDYGTIL